MLNSKFKPAHVRYTGIYTSIAVRSTTIQMFELDIRSFFLVFISKAILNLICNLFHFNSKVIYMRCRK